jgi:diadenosine tetraphosphate (Ap4A) HIT family hydrolase
MERVHKCALCRAVEQLPAETVVAAGDEWLTYVHPDLAQENCLWVQTRQHVEGLWSMTESQAASMGPTVSRAAQALRRARSAERVYVVSFGENHPHIHALVIARPPANRATEPRGTDLVAAVMSGFGHTDAAAAGRIAGSLRSYFGEH